MVSPSRFEGEFQAIAAALEMFGRILNPFRDGEPLEMETVRHFSDLDLRRAFYTIGRSEGENALQDRFLDGGVMRRIRVELRWRIRAQGRPNAAGNRSPRRALFA